MPRYLKAMIAGGIIGTAVGVYFLVRTKKIRNMMNMVKFHRHNKENTHPIAEKKSTGMGAILKRNTRVFAKKLVR